MPFRTWRNSITEEASEKLTELFQYNIPQRWSIAHLYQAILNREAHVPEIDFITTLDGYIHWKLTGERTLGVGEASGMFPIDPETKDYRRDMVEKFEALIADKKYPWKLSEILPKVLVAGEHAGVLSEEGAKLLDVSGNLEAGIPLCPSEGDAGTGMVATNSVASYRQCFRWNLCVRYARSGEGAVARVSGDRYGDDVRQVILWRWFIQTTVPPI